MKKFDNYNKVLLTLKEGIGDMSDFNRPVVRAGVIKQFEFTIDLAVKALKEYLEDQMYPDINTPRKVMQSAYSIDLIENDEVWLDMLNAGNLTSHLYDEKISISLCDKIITKYIYELELLRDKLSEVYS